MHENYYYLVYSQKAYILFQQTDLAWHHTKKEARDMYSHVYPVWTSQQSRLNYTIHPVLRTGSNKHDIDS